MLLPDQLRLLLVDDNEYARILAETELKNLGVGQVFQAEDAIEALSILQNEKIDIVLLDWHMPEINGGGLIRLLNLNKINVATIVMTAYATKENMKRFQALGLSNIVIKPFSQSQLGAALGEAMPHVQENAEAQKTPSASANIPANDIITSGTEDEVFL